MANLDHFFIVFNSVFQQFPGCFEVIQVCVKISQQDCYLDTTEEMNHHFSGGGVGEMGQGQETVGIY